MMCYDYVYLVWSKTFDSPIGVYSSEILADKIAKANNGKIYPLVMNGVHPGHLDSVLHIFGEDIHDFVCEMTAEIE